MDKKQKKYFIGMSTRTRNILLGEDIYCKEDLLNYFKKNKGGYTNLLRHPNIGRKTLQEIIRYFGLPKSDKEWRSYG